MDSQEQIVCTSASQIITALFAVVISGSNNLIAAGAGNNRPFGFALTHKLAGLGGLSSW